MTNQNIDDKTESAVQSAVVNDNHPQPTPEKTILRSFSGQVDKGNRFTKNLPNATVGVLALATIGALVYVASGYLKLGAPATPKSIEIAKATISTAPKPSLPASVEASPPAVNTSAPVAPASDAVAVANQDSTDVLALKTRIDEMETELATVQKTNATLLAKLRAFQQAPKQAAAMSTTPSTVTFDVLEIEPKMLKLSADNRFATVTLGGILPGGATFLGYDQSTRLLKTSRGEFPVQATQ